MKKTVLLFISLAFSLASFAQSQAYVKTLKKLEFGTTILDAAMMFKADHPEFKVIMDGPVQITVFTNPYDETQKIQIQALYLVNEKDQDLVELYYANDALYQKGSFWFEPKDSVTLVQTNYAKARNTFLSNSTLLQVEAGKVKSEETSYDLGKKTTFPIEKQGKKARVGEAGYELVYTPETKARGFWVYMTAYSTMNSALDSSMNFPMMSTPKGVFDELETLLSPIETAE
jgi:hypothetical protein